MFLQTFASSGLAFENMVQLQTSVSMLMNEFSDVAIGRNFLTTLIITICI
jgi:hypothetical protein